MAINCGTIKFCYVKATRKLPSEDVATSALIIGPSLLTSPQYRHHPAYEVYVTGTFDDWAKSVKLENKGEHFEKLVELPLSNEKIFYKVRYPTAAPFKDDQVWPTHKARNELSRCYCCHIPIL